jgi:hypothetical protein
LGELDRSLEDLDLALRLDPRVGFFYFQRGLTQQARKDWKHALADFDECAKLGGLGPTLDEARAQVQAELGCAAGGNTDRARAPGSGSAPVPDNPPRSKE